MEGTVVVVLDPVLVFAILACFPLVDELLDFLVLVGLGERIDSRKVLTLPLLFLPHLTRFGRRPLYLSLIHIWTLPTICSV